MKDYESVIVIIYSSDTTLFTESAVIADSVQQVSYSEKYQSMIAVPEGATPTPEQYQTYGSRREFVVGTMNRGQVIRFTVLNAVHTEGGPSIWADIQHKGVTCKFRRQRVEILGVP